MVLAIAIITGGVWLVREWYQDLPRDASRVVTDGEVSNTDRRETLRPTERILHWRPGMDRTTGKLAGGLALLLLSVCGQWINPRLWLKAGEPRPELTGGKVIPLRQPDGTQLHVEAFGPEDGRTIVAVHGWGTDRREWSYLRKHCPHLRLVLWDLAGSGRSSRPNNDDYSLEKFARDLRAVIDACGDQRIVLLGHSIGGMTILTFCRLYSELLGPRVCGIVLTHTTYTNPLRTMPMSGLLTVLEKPVIVPLLYLQIGLSPLVWLSNCLSYFNGSMHWSNSRSGFAGTETRSQLDFISSYSLDVSPAVLARGCLGMLSYDATGTLPKIHVPVLVISGDRDPVTPQHASEFIASHVPKAELKVLKPAKHYGFIEHTPEFGEHVSEFCFRSEKMTPALAVEAS